MVNTYACKKATRVSRAYIKNNKKNHATAGSAVTKSMLNTANCKKIVVAKENTAKTI